MRFSKSEELEGGMPRADQEEKERRRGLRSYPSRVVLGALELLLEPVEVRLRLLQRRLRLLLLQLVFHRRRLKQNRDEEGQCKSLKLHLHFAFRIKNATGVEL